MKPILFNTEMVRAILGGKKTVTRRVIKQQPIDSVDCKHELKTFREMLPEYYSDDYSAACRKCGYGVCPSGESIYKPPSVPGDILYVRETWCDPSGTGYPIMYKADMPIHYDAEETEIGEPIDLRAEDYTWKPSIHMPRDYARIFLSVTNVRVERLQDIMNDPPGLNNQVVREGCKYGCDFIAPWDRTVKGKETQLYGWDANPWVWVIEFERISAEEAYGTEYND